ncbi:hypothetical protein BDN72DRAFT_893643 [Pluteus cervinus]|uniref:Uncharacterized protein n=1 Tax=Pluteus cervinus TaxID=181527 RepID=A0ACD3B766_9AGAR|nr:hypothetical protein BDN72DRAFT_893643 [Pluteus cervinus]
MVTQALAYTHRGTQTEALGARETEPPLVQTNSRSPGIGRLSGADYLSKPRLPSTLPLFQARRVHSLPEEGQAITIEVIPGARTVSLSSWKQDETSEVLFPDDEASDPADFRQGELAPPHEEDAENIPLLVETRGGYQDFPCYAGLKSREVWEHSPPRPIPALHGPLSLPYARCPSGAEGVIMDDDNTPPIWGLPISNTRPRTTSQPRLITKRHVKMPLQESVRPVVRDREEVDTWTRPTTTETITTPSVSSSHYETTENDSLSLQFQGLSLLYPSEVPLQQARANTRAPKPQVSERSLHADFLGGSEHPASFNTRLQGFSRHSLMSTIDQAPEYSSSYRTFTTGAPRTLGNGYVNFHSQHLPGIHAAQGKKAASGVSAHDHGRERKSSTTTKRTPRGEKENASPWNSMPSGFTSTR